MLYTASQEESETMARILVIKDEVDICNLLRSELEAEGYSVGYRFVS